MTRGDLIELSGLWATWGEGLGGSEEEAARHEGVTYVDTWELTTGRDGGYSAYLHDDDGDGNGVNDGAGEDNDATDGPTTPTMAMPLLTMAAMVTAMTTTATMATLTTMAAFLPMLLMTGTTGEYMGFLPKTVTIALSASLSLFCSHRFSSCVSRVCMS